MSKLYPLLFEPIYKKMIWGSESWDISCREQEMGIIKNGPLKGRTFISVINENPAGYMGIWHSDFTKFPLLVKIIETHDFLSIQVHPTDTYAQQADNYPFGKNEMWYILSAQPESYLIIGLNDGVSKETFKNAIQTGNVEEQLHKLYIKPGDVINIPAGLIHAIGKDIVLAEVQQNSDLTYRVYDYNRLGQDGLPRQLHIEKSLDVIDFDDRFSKAPVTGETIMSDNDSHIYAYIKNEFFTIDLYDINGEYEESSDTSHFHIFTCVSGSAAILQAGNETLLETGDSVFIPATLGKYTISGNCRLLKSFA